MERHTPRKIENKKSLFKISICILSSNLFLVFVFILLREQSPPIRNSFILPKNHLAVIINGYSNVVSEKTEIIAVNKKGKIILKKAILIKQLTDGSPAKYKIAIPTNHLNKLTTNNPRILYLYPFAGNNKPLNKEKKIEITF